MPALPEWRLAHVPRSHYSQWRTSGQCSLCSRGLCLCVRVVRSRGQDRRSLVALAALLRLCFRRRGGLRGCLTLCVAALATPS